MLCEPARTREMGGMELLESSAAGREQEPAVMKAAGESRLVKQREASAPDAPGIGPPEQDAEGDEARRCLGSVEMEDTEQWTVYLRRRNRSRSLDDRCLILWGLPTQTDPDLFAAKMRTSASCWWRGRRSNRHLVMEFQSELHRKVVMTDTRNKCKELNIKMAVVSRRYTTRKHHRTQSKTPSVARGRPANEYTVLDDDAGNTEEDFIPLELPADLSRPNESKPTPVEGTKRGDLAKKSHSGTRAGGKRAKARPGSKRFERLQQKAQLGKELCRTLLRVGSFNAQGGVINSIGELESHANSTGIDVLAVQESRLKPSMKLSAHGYKVYRQQKELEDPRHGVLFLVRNSLAGGIAKEKSERADQLWIRLTGTDGKKDIVFCAAYMPQETATVLERETAYETLQNRAKEFAADSEVVILGDMNAKVCGPVNEEERVILGDYCEPGKRTGNGRLLVSLMKEAGMVSLAGHFKPTDRADPSAESRFWWSRRDPLTGAYHLIDYILVTSALHSDDSSFRVDDTDLDSDHHLLVAKIRCPRKLGGKSLQQRRRRFKTERLIQRSSSREEVERAQKCKDEYARQAAKALADFTPRLVRSSKCGCAGSCACRSVNEFVHRATIALEKSVGSVPVGRQFNRSWFDEEVRQAIATRRAIHDNAASTGYTASVWKRYRQARRNVRRLVASKKRADWENFERDIERAYSSDHRRLWQLISRLVPSNKKAVLEPVRRPDGTLAKSMEDILDTWANHQEKLGQPSVDEYDDGSFTAQVESQMRAAVKLSPTLPETALDKPFTMVELTTCLEKLQYHKATTSDDTSGEMLIFGGDAFRQHLLTLFNWLLKTESIPTTWQSATIVNLFKEGDRSDPTNYRGIALISCIGKVYSSLWANRLADYGEMVLSEEQGGFRQRRSTVDQALTLREVLTRRKAEGKATYLCFVDFRKAFDTVWHAGLWKRLWDSKIRGKAWRIIQTLYSSIRAKVRLGNSTSREVLMKQGVRQGCPLSPTLFNFFVDELSKQLRATGCGICHGGIDIGSLLYADDVVLIADSPDDLQTLIDTVDGFCRKWKMSMNMKKSEVMVVKAPGVKSPTHTWECRDETLKVVSRYKYLGIWFTDDLKWKVHFEVMLEKVRKRTLSIGKVLRNKNIPLRAKTLVWLALVRPLMEYGAEVWQANKTQSLQMARNLLQAGKQALRVNVHTHAEAVRALLHIPELRTRHEQARLKYMAKLMAMHPGRLARAVLFRGGRSDWWVDTKKLVDQHDTLAEGFVLLRRSADRNHGVLPLGIDPTVDGDFEYSPMKAWRSRVEEWGHSLTLSKFRKNRGSSLKLLQRAVAQPVSLEVGEEITRIPRFPLTRNANHGPNQIRLRLLCGTSGLNVTLAKWRDRPSSCPFDSCVGGDEDAVHFLLYCRGYEKLRTHFRSGLKQQCRCARDNDAVPCAEFFESLDDAGKALFMLGGPVDGRTPEASIDACSLQFVRAAWKVRCDTLSSQNSESKSELDLTLEEERALLGSESVSPPRGGKALAPTAADGTKDPKSSRHSSDEAQQLITAHFSRSSRTGEANNFRSRIAQLATTTITTTDTVVDRSHNGSGPNVEINTGRG